MIILLNIVFIIFCFIWYFLYKTYKKNKILVNEILRVSQNKVIIWVVTKYKQEDIERLKASPDYIKIILKYIEYNIAKKTDIIRNLQDWISTEQKVWYLNCLHENYIFFNKLLSEKDEDDEKYTWQNLK